jgi:molybdenum cofactor cytidylyltransferase
MASPRRCCVAEDPWPAVVLAAGESARLGRPKQLVEIEGESLVRRSVRAAMEAGFAPVYVVLGAVAEEVRRELAGTDAVFVENAEWREGMGSSLRRGVGEAAAQRPAHLLVMVCDQPAVTSDLLRRMRQQHLAADAPVTAAEYAGVLGVPAIFSRALFADLLAVTGDRGARGVIGRYSAQAGRVAFEAGAWDVDSPDDLRVRPA